MADRDEIFEKVSEILQDALGADEDEVTPEARLVQDLDAESIDFLDITFNLEKQFDVKIPRAELFPGPGDLGGDDEADKFIQDGKLTDEGVSELKSRLPHADTDSLASAPTVEQVQELYTVNMIVNYIEKKL